MIVPLFTLLQFSNSDGTLARMEHMKMYFSVMHNLQGSYGFFELIKISVPTWDWYKPKVERKEGE